MRFANPTWWMALMVIPLLAGLYLQELSQRSKIFEKFIQKDLLSRLMPEYAPYRTTIRRVLSLFSITACIIALARPQFGVQEHTQSMIGSDIVIALDVSTSMLAQDIRPSRISKAKLWMESFIQKSSFHRIGIVVFAGSSFIASPLTTDRQYLSQIIQTLEPGMIQNQGTNIALALQTSLEALEHGGSTTHDTIPQAAMIMISDGEDHHEEALQKAQMLATSGITFFALGIGTSAGAPIPLPHSGSFKLDRSGKKVITAFHPDYLKKLSAAAKGSYLDLEDLSGTQTHILSQLKTSATQKLETLSMQYSEQFQIPLLLGILLILLEWCIAVRKKAVLPVLLLFSISILEARETENKEAFKAYEKGVEAAEKKDWDEALKNFGRAQAHDPYLIEMLYDQGLMHFFKKDIKAALRSFDQAIQRGENSEIEILSLYNKAQALKQEKRYAEAAQAFAQAQERATALNLPQRAAEVSKALQELLKQPPQEKKPNPNEPPDDPNKQEGEQHEKQDDKQQEGEHKEPKKSDEDNKPSKPKENPSSKPDTQTSPKKQEDQKPSPSIFKPGNGLSEEDAKKIIAEIQNKEAPKKFPEQQKSKRNQLLTEDQDW